MPFGSNAELNDDIATAEGFLGEVDADATGRMASWRSERPRTRPTPPVRAPRPSCCGRACPSCSRPSRSPKVRTVESHGGGDSSLRQALTYTLLERDGDQVDLDVEAEQTPAVTELDSGEGLTLRVVDSGTETRSGTLNIDLASPLPTSGLIDFVTTVTYGSGENPVGPAWPTIPARASCSRPTGPSNSASSRTPNAERRPRIPPDAGLPAAPAWIRHDRTALVDPRWPAAPAASRPGARQPGARQPGAPTGPSGPARRRRVWGGWAPSAGGGGSTPSGRHIGGTWSGATFCTRARPGLGQLPLAVDVAELHALDQLRRLPGGSGSDRQGRRTAGRRRRGSHGRAFKVMAISSRRGLAALQGSH